MLAVVNPIEEPLNPSLPYCRDVRGVSGEVESCTSDRSSSALIILYRSVGKLCVNTLPWIVSISRALSTLRGLRGAPEVPHYAERRSLSDSTCWNLVAKTQQWAQMG